MSCICLFFFCVCDLVLLNSSVKNLFGFFPPPTPPSIKYFNPVLHTLSTIQMLCVKYRLKTALEHDYEVR